jgi:hypothetical protein
VGKLSFSLAQKIESLFKSIRKTELLIDYQAKEEIKINLII